MHNLGMLLPRLAAFLAVVVASALQAQQLPAADAGVLKIARSRYYNLAAAGFQSLSCTVKFEVPSTPAPAFAAEDNFYEQRLVERSVMSLTLDERGRPTVTASMPTASSERVRQTVAEQIARRKSLVAGLFQTWTSKGFQGPIPPFDAQIDSVTATDAGYSLSLRVPGAPAKILMDKSYLVNTILSNGGKLEEHPTFIPTPDGLVFTGNRAVDTSGATSVSVSYELETTPIDGLRLPSSAHLKVNDNIDVRFALTACVVRKGTVVRVDPPPRP